MGKAVSGLGSEWLFSHQLPIHQDKRKSHIMFSFVSKKCLKMNEGTIHLNLQKSLVDLKFIRIFRSLMPWKRLYGLCDCE